MECEKCQGDMWDNTTNKRNPKGPDYKCKNKGCNHAVWLPKGTLPPKQPEKKERNNGAEIGAIALTKSMLEGQYFLKDNFYRFWFMMVYHRKSLERIRSELDPFYGPVFEDLCIQYTRQHLEYERAGRWWKRGNEIDIIGMGKGKPPLIGECKWSRNKIDVDVYNHLLSKKKPFTDKEVKYCLFSRKGFTKRLRSIAAREDVLLVDLKDICKG